MSNQTVTLIADLLRLPIDGTAAAPSISFGGGIGVTGESGTGFYGTETALNASVGASNIMALSSSGVAVTGTLSATGVLSGSSLTMACSVKIILNAGVPVDGTTGAGAAKGSLLIDTTNANIYINANTSVSPTWKLVTRAA